MSKVTTLSLVDLLGSNQPEHPQVESFYQDAMIDMGKAGLFNIVSLVAGVAGQATYTIPAGGIEILGVFYDDTLLSLETLRRLEAVNPHWRDEKGRPVAYVRDELSRNVIQLYPAPVVNAGFFIFLHGAPFGLDYPGDAVVFIHSDTRVDLPPYMDLPIAFGILAREFGRDSTHQDENFSTACKSLFDLFFGMVQ